MTHMLFTTKLGRTPNIELVELNRLKPHEEVDSVHLKELTEEIKSDKILKFAIAAENDGDIILDGHHRVAALKELGCTKIPVVFVDYRSSDIEVQSQRNPVEVTKEEIVKAGMGLKKLPPKTSKHMIRINGVLKHISVIEKRVDIPLEELKGDSE
jgi:ParB-like chromosome segregation protein Spo0J